MSGLICHSLAVCGYIILVSGAPIRKLTDVPIIDILAVVISDADTDTDIKQ